MNSAPTTMLSRLSATSVSSDIPGDRGPAVAKVAAKPEKSARSARYTPTPTAKISDSTVSTGQMNQAASAIRHHRLRGPGFEPGQLHEGSTRRHQAVREECRDGRSRHHRDQQDGGDENDSPWRETHSGRQTSHAPP